MAVDYPEMPHVHYHVNRIIRNMLIKCKNEVFAENDDKKFMIGGKTGSGKSMLAKQLAYALDPEFKQRNICYNNEGFYKALERAEGKKGVAIIHDEAFRDFGSNTSMTRAGKELLNTLMEMRQQNLFLFLVTPEVNKLYSSLTKLEANGMFYVWKPRDKTSKHLRIFRAWGQTGTTKIMEIAAKTKNLITAVTQTPYVARGEFYNICPKPINYEEYEKNKSVDYFKRIRERRLMAVENKKKELGGEE